MKLGQFTIILFLLVFILMPAVISFSISNDFSDPILNTSIYSNFSNNGTVTMDIAGGKLNFYGNNTGSIQYNGGVYLSSKITINASLDGQLSYDFQLETLLSKNNYMYISLGYPLGSAGIGVTMSRTEIYAVNYDTGLRACSGDVKTPDLNQHTITMLVDRAYPNVNYYWYYDGAYWCSITQTTVVNLPFNFTFVADNNTYKKMTIDNLIFSDNTSSTTYGNGTLPLNSYCTKNDDCISGKCEYHKCALKSGLAECLNNMECITGSCIMSRCTQPDLWTNLEYSKNQQFGTGTATNNFISLFLMLGIALGIMIIGKGSLAAVIGGGVSFMGLAIFFTLVGWLSPFILIGAFLICIVLAILAVTMLR